MDPIRRNMLATGAAATVMAAAPQVFAQQAGPGGAATSFYEKGDVRIRYQEVGSGFPLLVTPGGGLNSRISNWATAVFNAMEVFKNDFRCITMDQRNANGGESTGPIPVDDPWGAFADDQLGLMDHLGIRQFFFMGYCIGGPFAPQADGAGPGPRRRRRAVPAGRAPAGEPGRDVQLRPRCLGPRAPRPTARRDRWKPSRSTCTTSTASGPTSCTACRATSRVPARRRCWSCRTTPRRTPYQTSVDIASLAPNAEVTVYPWKEPPELKARTINRVRNFLKAHQPVTAAR